MATRLDWPDIGEAGYPIGYPRGTGRIEAVTKGWISSHIPERDWPDIGHDKRLDILSHTGEGLAGYRP